jgi:Zn-dependent protease
MFGKRLHLCTLFGFDINIDISWTVIAFLIVWSLVTGFPQYYPGYAVYIYWAMGIAGAAGFFFSIVFHEFFHSLVARRFNLQMKGITLFLFGGVAEIGDETPLSPRAEFFMAAAGPLSSAGLGLMFWGLENAGAALAWPAAAVGVFTYLRIVNVVLALFNMVPAFPMDGGRILRAILWKYRNIEWATRISSEIGNGFGWLLIIVGMFTLLRGMVLVGVWYMLVGLFIRGIARLAYRQVRYSGT